MKTPPNGLQAGELKISCENLGSGLRVLLPQGSVDSATAAQFRTEVEKMMEEKAGSVLLDMVDVKYISSMGLSALIYLMKKAKETGTEFALYDPQISVRRVLQISKLDFLETNPTALDPAHPFFAYIEGREPVRRELRKKRETDARNLNRNRSKLR